MTVCFWCIPGGSTQFYFGDTGIGEYGGECKPVSYDGGYIASYKYGWKQFIVYLLFDRNYLKCGKKRGTG